MMLLVHKHIPLTLCLLVSFLAKSYWAFDEQHESHDTVVNAKAPMPKDKVLLKDVKTLTFLRNKRTTSKRTHSIHQLSCVGGTAGCRLFTPNVVECENIGFDHGRSKYNWRCHADTSDRVKFNHVEVICEGYDYPEDDYILLGSCGLEFTLDYTDPQDYHHNSYFKHMDEHEKEMHHERVRATAKPATLKQGYSDFLDPLISNLKQHMFLIGSFLLLAMFSFVIVKLLATSRETNRSSGKKQAQRGSSYGPLTSAVLTTKKAC